jgi:aspartyl-tRNA synthetase
VRFLRVPRSPAQHARELTEREEWGAKGLAYIVYGETGRRGRRLKFSRRPSRPCSRATPARLWFSYADGFEQTSRVLGPLRLELANRLGLIDESKQAWLWVTDFPMFEWDEDEQRYGAKHHPFTRPAAEWVDRFDDDPAHAIAHAYDLIGNGNELGGGSFRIHEADLQARAFALLNLTPEQQRAKFGFLLDALAMGAPPHGGIALGIDRTTMVLAGEPNLRDVIAFPKNQAGMDPMSGAPSEVTQAQLDELGIEIVADPD